MPKQEKKFMTLLAERFSEEMRENEDFRKSVLDQRFYINAWNDIFFYLQRDKMGHGVEMFEYLRKTYYQEIPEFSDVIEHIESDEKYLEKNSHLAELQKAPWVAELKKLQVEGKLKSPKDIELLEMIDQTIFTTDEVVDAFLKEVRELREDLNNLLMSEKEFENVLEIMLREQTYQPLYWNDGFASMLKDEWRPLGKHFLNREKISQSLEDASDEREERFFNPSLEKVHLRSSKLTTKDVVFPVEHAAEKIWVSRHKKGLVSPAADVAYEFLLRVEHKPLNSLPKMLSMTDDEREHHLKSVFGRYGVFLEEYPSWHEAVFYAVSYSDQLLAEIIAEPFLQRAEEAIVRNAPLLLAVAEKTFCRKEFTDMLRRIHVKNSPTKIPSFHGQEPHFAEKRPSKNRRGKN